MKWRKVFRKYQAIWEPCEFEQLKKGDWFRLYEPDGTFLGEYRAKEDASPEPSINGNYKIIVDAEKMEKELNETSPR
jgi:hypothetical protein